MNQRKAGTILSYVYIIVSNTISLIYTPYMLRLMGQSEYGLYSTASSFVSYLSILSFGIGGAYIRFNAKYRAKNDRDGEKRLNGMFLVIFSFLAFLVFIGGSVLTILVGKLTENTFSPQELFKVRVIIMVLTISTMFTFIFNVVMMALQAYEKFIFIRIILLIANIIQPIINIVALNMGGRSISISVASLFVTVATYITFYIYAKKVIRLEFLFHGFQKEEIRELFIFSMYLFIGSISDQITSSTDQVVLSAVKGTTAVAIYNVGASFKIYFANFSSSISSVFASHVNKMIASDSDMSQLDEVFIKVGRIQFYVVSLIFIGYTSVGYDFIRLWAGEDYKDSYWIGLILICSAIIPCFQNVGIEIQKALNKHKARSIVYLLVAFVNIILTIPFSIYWGGIGAAFATLLCVILGQVVFMNYYYHFHIHLDIVKFWKSILAILPGFIIPVGVLFIINRMWKMDSLWDILVAACVIVIAYIISIWNFSMNEYEKELFVNPIRKLLKGKKTK